MTTIGSATTLPATAAPDALGASAGEGSRGRLAAAGIDATTQDLVESFIAGARQEQAGTTAPGTTPTAPVAPAAPAPAAPAPATPTAPGTAASGEASLDGPDPTYPGLLHAHVLVLEAVGTPPHVLASISADPPSADDMEVYLQSEIMQAPEEWDAFVGNPAGTARAGLQRLFPQMEIPAPGQGRPGEVLADGTNVLPSVPGVTEPLVQPGQSPKNGLETGLKWLVWGAAAAGVAALGWKFMKGREAAKVASAAGQAAEGVAGAAAAAAGGGPTGAGVGRVLASLDEGFAAATKGGGGKGWKFGKAGAEAATHSADVARRALLAEAAGAGTMGGAHVAQIDQALSGMRPGHEWLSQVGNFARQYGETVQGAGGLAIANSLAQNPNLGQVVAASPSLADELGQVLAAAVRHAK